MKPKLFLALFNQKVQKVSLKGMDTKQMNRLEVTIKEIQNSDCIHLTTLDYKGSELHMLSLELSKDLKVGQRVAVTTKATHISLAKNFIDNISCSNQFLVKVKEIKKGELVSVVKVDFNGTSLESVITTKALQKVNIEKNDEVIMLVKSSEISILELLDA